MDTCRASATRAYKLCMGDVNPSDEFSEWLDHGVALRAKYETEEKDLLARLARVREALAKLPTLNGPTQAPPAKEIIAKAKAENVGSKKGAKPSVTWTLLAMLEATPGGLTAGQIVERMHEISPKTKKSVIHGMLYTLRVRDNRIEQFGEKGSYRYRLATRTEKKSAA